MKKTFFNLMLCITLGLAASSCKKKDEPTPVVPVDDRLEQMLKKWAGEVVGADLSTAKIVITYGSDYNTGKAGPQTTIVAKNDLTLDFINVINTVAFRDFSRDNTTKPLISLDRRYYLKQYPDFSTDGVKFKSTSTAGKGKVEIIRTFVTSTSLGSEVPEPEIWKATIDL